LTLDVVGKARNDPGVTRLRPTPALAVAILALVVALAGTSYAAVVIANGSVGTAQLKRNAVTSPKIKNRSVRSADLAKPGRWKPLSLGAGWAWASAGDTQTPQFRRDQLGQVHLRGPVTKTSGSPSYGNLIATVPAGYAPKHALILTVPSGLPNAVGSVLITPDGGVYWASGSVGEPDYTELSSISYWTD